MRSRNPRLSAVESYSEAFRDLVNDRVGWKGDPARKLRLNSDEDWSFVCVAIDILGDASLALHNFMEFGIGGPTKYDDTGEKYLRLYGLLSAAYIQQQAALKLHNLMNCTKQKDFKRRADQLSIRALRHQLASHSLDCKDFTANAVSAFVPVRIELDGFNCTVTENRGDRSASYNLRDAVKYHCEFMLDLLDATYEKSYRTLFQNHPAKLGEHAGKLEELRHAKAGNLTFRSQHPNGPNIVIVPMKASREET